MQRARMCAVIGACVLLSSCLQAQIPGDTSIEIRPGQRRNARESLSPPLLVTATAVLKSLPGELGSGFGEANVFTNGSMRMSIRTNLVPLERGEYVAWLRGVALPEPVRIGVLRNPKGDTTYLLQGEESIQLPHLGNAEQEWQLTINYEPHDPSQRKSTTILEGTFTVKSPL